MREGRNQYAPMQGVTTLREAIARKYDALYGAAYDPGDEITVTSGATEAIFDAVMALVAPGDEVIVFEPCYDSYVPAITLAGGRPVFVGLEYPDYRIDWDAVRRALTPRTRMLMVNTPHNPTGSVWRREDVDALRAIVAGTPLLVLGDEVYEHIIFDGLPHLSLAADPDLRARSIVIGSFGKTFHTTGWKIGYAAAPPDLTTEFRKVHQFVTFTSNTPVQHAIAEYLGDPARYLDLPAFYQAKRDRFLDLVAGSRFRPLACHGSYFVLLDYSSITDEADAAFARRLTRELGVASIPTSAFLYERGAPPVLRFCFAKKDETLVEACRRLCRL
jgi:methionine aminotransferase